MFGRNTSSLLDRGPRMPEFDNMFAAVDYVVQSPKRLELTVHGTTISGHRPLISVGAQDAIHDRVLHLGPRFMSTYGKTHFLTIVIVGRNGNREMITDHSKDGDGDDDVIARYKKWAGSRSDIYFDTVSWHINLHRN